MSEPTPPLARKTPHVLTVHGDARNDDYHWLRDRADPAVIEYLEAENEYTQAMTAHLEPLRESVYQEMRGRIKETDSTAPYRKDDYWYYSRTEEGKQYSIHCRKPRDLDARETVLLDVNALAEGEEYCQLGVLRVSPDHRLLAYSVDTTGAETYTLYVKDLHTGDLLPDVIPNTYYSAEWANDGVTLFYTILDEAKRPFTVFRHTLGSDPSEDVEVFHEPDEAFYVSLSKTRSRAFLLLTTESKTTSEVRYLSADVPDEAFRVVHPREPDIEYSVEHHGDRFFIVTNHDATNFKVMETPLDRPGREYWVPVVPYREDIKVDAVDAFRSHLVIWQRENGLTGIRVLDLESGELHTVTFPEPVFTVVPGTNAEFDTRVLRFEYSSLVTPLSVYDYDMVTRERELKKQTEVLGGYDASRYRSERVLAKAPDGTTVPISLVYRTPYERDGKRPMLLYGYGSYGISIDPTFSSERVSLLDRGIAFAIAHIRGGGEMGRTWYDRGKLAQKKHTFSDFIAAAEHLIAGRYTAADRLAIRGGSAGGLLMGAVVNQQPDLFHAMVAEVPFVDVVNTMLDASLPLTVTEYEEWGNPNEADVFEYVRSYSPYDNVRQQRYPHILITAGLNDPRVQYWEPAKWTAKLRAYKADENLLLLKTNMGAGHGGASGRYDRLRELAFWMAFVVDQVSSTR